MISGPVLVDLFGCEKIATPSQSAPPWVRPGSSVCWLPVEAAQQVDAAKLEQHLKDNVTAPEGFEHTIDCPDALAGKVDAAADCTVSDGEGQTCVRFVTTEVDGKDVTFECTATSQGEEGTVEVTVTQVDGLRIGFSAEAVE